MNEINKQFELLEQELLMMQENILRIKILKKEYENSNYKPCKSSVIGEFKHRIVSIKQRLTLVSKITTFDFLNKN